MNDAAMLRAIHDGDWDTIDQEMRDLIAEYGITPSDFGGAVSQRSIRRWFGQHDVGVYFVESAGRVKIGYSAQFQKRLKALRAGSPYPVTVLAVIPGDRTVEKRYHEQLDPFRVHNEWFDLPDSIKEAIRNVGQDI